MATDDPVLHALVDLTKAVSRMEHHEGDLAIAYGAAMQVLRDKVCIKRPEEITATRVELSNKARHIIMEMQHTYGVPAALLDELRELDHQFHACEPQPERE